MNNITIAKYAIINGLILLCASLVGIFVYENIQTGYMYMLFGLPAIIIVYFGLNFSFELFILSSVVINIALFVFVHTLLVNFRLHKLGYIFTAVFTGLNIILGYYLNIIFSL